MRVDLRIDPHFQKLWPALTAEEQPLLEQSLKTQGCRDALVVWAEEEGQPPILLDGHHRYAICTRLQIPFRTVLADHIRTRMDAILWIGTNQLGRRNSTPSQKSAFGLELEEQLAVEAKKRQLAGLKQGNKKPVQANLPEREQGSQPSYRCPYCHRVYQEKHICREMGQARDQAAKLAGVSPRYISEAKAIKEKAPEV